MGRQRASSSIPIPWSGYLHDGGGGGGATGYGEPKLVLDYSPTGTGGPYLGSYTGIDHTIDGVLWKVQDQDSGGATIGTVTLTAGGLKLVHTGTSGKALCLRFDGSALTGMTGTFNNMAVQASFTVTQFDRANSSLNLLINQSMPANADATSNTQYDMQAQAVRFSANNYGVRALRRNSGGAATIYGYSSTNLSNSGAPAAIQLGFFGGAYTWWIGGDIGTGPSTFQQFGLGTNQRKLTMQGSGAFYPGASPDGSGIAHPVMSILVGTSSGSAGTEDFTLTNLRIWTYGTP